MRLIQHCKEKYRGDRFYLFWDLFWSLFFYIGASLAVGDIKERAAFLFTSEKASGVVVQATYDMRLIPQPNGRPEVHKLVPVAEVEYNGEMKFMDNRDDLEAGDSVAVRYLSDKPAEWRPMSRFSLSPISLLIMPNKQALSIYSYVSLWIFTAIVLFVIIMLILPSKEKKSAD